MFKSLIVEDNGNYRKILKQSLEERFPFMSVEEVADGKEALQRIGTFLPHLIFMDVQLPGESGLHLTKKIKIDHPEIVVVILTSFDFPEYREAAVQYGASHYFTKDSLNLNEIEEIVKSIGWT